MHGEPDPQYVLARKVLLDALDALGEHSANVVVIGAQAVYHWAGDSDLKVAMFTSDADVALDPRALADAPLLEHALGSAGFSHRGNPGEWSGTNGVPFDILVPLALAVGKGRRSVRIPPHSDRVARKADGIEGCVVDVSIEKITAFDPADPRSVTARIAGPAGLIVAKLIKIEERAEQRGRLVAKDALDLHRLFLARDTEDLAMRMATLLGDDMSREATARALDILDRRFADPEALGPKLVVEAIGLTEAGEGERDRSVALTRELLRSLES